MAQEDLPPQGSRIALYSAGGGFGGALLAIIVAKLLAGPCCCLAPPGAPADMPRKAAAAEVLSAARDPEMSAAD